VWDDWAAAAGRSWMAAFLLLYSLAIVAHYFVLQALAFLEARAQRRQARVVDRLSLFEDDLTPPISILVPAYNEAPTIVDSVRSLMQLRYPSFEIIVVNDGSTDATLDELIRTFRLRSSRRTLRSRVPRERVRGAYSSPDYPFLLVLDVVNGGKAQALNLALAMARHPLCCAIDADSVLEQDTLLQLVRPFFRDPATIVVGGVVRPANGCRVVGGRVLEARLPAGHWARFQNVEYLRGMLAGRLGWNRLDSLFIVSGALGLFSREAMLAVGGYRTDTLGEDMELVMRLQRWAGRNGRSRAVRFVGGAVAWTEVPENGRSLRRQRARWHQGLAESLWLNRELFVSQHFTFRHGLAFLAQVLFELLGPLVEAGGFLLLLALLAAGRLQVPYVALYLGIFVVGGTLHSLLGIALEAVACPRYRRTRELATLMGYALLENFGYRQLTTLWRIEGLWNAIRRKQVWGAIVRRGHAATGTDAPAEPGDGSVSRRAA